MEQEKHYLKKVLSLLLCLLTVVSLFTGTLSTTTFAAVGDNNFEEVESNNTMSTADRIYNDYTVSGVLSGVDLDYFKFTVSSQTTISITVISEYSSFLMGLYNSSDEILKTALPSGTTSNGYYAYSMTCTVSSGTYYLCLVDSDKSYNSYMFYIELSTIHSHAYSLKYNSSSHWYECSCGAVRDTASHYGGTSTCSVKAVCSLCKASYGSYGNHSFIAATCSQKANCRYCGLEYGELAAHKGGTATCLNKAICIDCGEEYGELADHKGGTATCSSKANCDVCGEAYGDLGDHSGGKATCSERATCSVCGEYYGYLLSHTYTFEADEYSHRKKCTKCSYVSAEESHYGGNASCTAKAQCSACGLEYGQLGEHDGVIRYDNYSHWYECDCGELFDQRVHTGGTSTCKDKKVCEVCGGKYGQTLPHTPAINPAIEPTCTETGCTEGSYCSVCYSVIEQQKEIPALGHTYDEGFVEVEATCDSVGIMVYNCVNCNKSYSDMISEISHTYQNGECTVCGAWQYKNTAVTLKSVKNTTSGVYLSWSKLPGADKYVVYRKTTGGWTKLTTNAKGTSFTDKTAKNNVKYTYTVRAINGTEYNTTYNKTGLKITFMSAPKISKVENTASGVKVTWGKVSGATSYNVYRKTTGGWTKLVSTKSTSFTDKKAKAGTKYTYTIIAAKSGAKSSYYSGKAIVRLTVPKLTKLTATSKKNTLTFGKVTGATSYIIYRKTGNGGWQKIATTKSTKYVDTKVKKGTYYTYTVRAVNGSSTSYYNTKGLKVRAK